MDFLQMWCIFKATVEMLNYHLVKYHGLYVVSTNWSGDENIHHFHRAIYNIQYTFCLYIYRVLQLSVLESSSLYLHIWRGVTRLWLILIILSLFVAAVFSLHRFADSDCSFGIFLYTLSMIPTHLEMTEWSAWMTCSEIISLASLSSLSMIYVEI